MIMPTAVEPANVDQTERFKHEVRFPQFNVFLLLLSALNSRLSASASVSLSGLSLCSLSLSLRMSLAYICTPSSETRAISKETCACYWLQVCATVHAYKHTYTQTARLYRMMYRHLPPDSKGKRLKKPSTHAGRSTNAAQHRSRFRQHCRKLGRSSATV